MISLSEDIIETLNSEPVLNFLVSARKFIDIIEDNSQTEDEFYRQSHLALIQLYSTALLLPDINLRYSDEKSDFDAENLFNNDYHGISNNLGKFAFYSETFDPIYPTDNEPTQGWLVDDYNDIYRDIKTELCKIEILTNEAVEDALWQLKFGFKTHWGYHCINALRALHYLKFDHKGF
jgi:hypothetical protein